MMALPVSIQNEFELIVGKNVIRGERGVDVVQVFERSTAGEKLIFEVSTEAAAELGIALRSISACVRFS